MEKNKLTLIEKHCTPCDTKIVALTIEEARAMLHSIPEWQIKQGVPKLFKSFQFKNFYRTMAFANAIAWIAHQENHHPYLVIEYNKCTVEYWTHKINGLSENDFICAAKVNQLYSIKI